VVEEVSEKIYSRNSNKQTGLDTILPSILKECRHKNPELLRVMCVSLLNQSCYNENRRA